MRRREALTALATLDCGVALAQGAAWPERPLRIVVAYPPGGVSDGVARALAERLARQLAVQVVVDHRAGAGGAAHRRERFFVPWERAAVR